MYSTAHRAIQPGSSCAQFCSRSMGGCLPACWILDRTHCSSCTAQNLLCSLLRQQGQQCFPLMVYRLHLSKLRLALNGISTRTVKCGDQDAFGNRTDSMAVVKQQRSERVVHSAKKASCVVLPPACESSIRNGDAFRYDKEDFLSCSTAQTL